MLCPGPSHRVAHKGGVEAAMAWYPQAASEPGDENRKDGRVPWSMACDQNVSAASKGLGDGQGGGGGASAARGRSPPHSRMTAPSSAGAKSTSVLSRPHEMDSPTAARAGCAE